PVELDLILQKQVVDHAVSLASLGGRSDPHLALRVVITLSQTSFSFAIRAGSNSLSPAMMSSGHVRSFSWPARVNSCIPSNHSAMVALAYPDLMRRSLCVSALTKD